MNQLKKIFLGLAVVVALGSIGANSALAQLTCTGNAGTPIVRSQGIAEQTGTITLACTEPGGTGAIAAQSITESIQPASANVTNGAAAPTISVSAGGGAFAVTGVGVISGNTVTFPTPAIPACAAVPPATCTFTVVLGINPALPLTTIAVRANIFASGLTFPSQLQGILTTPPNGVITITNNVYNVATPLPGMTASFGTAPAIPQCATATSRGVPTTLTLTAIPTGGAVPNLAAILTATDPVNASVKAPTAVDVVTVTEGFATAFQPAAGEGVDATQGTRITISTASLPSNTTLVVPNFLFAPTAGGATIVLSFVSGADANGAGGAFTPVPGGGFVAGTNFGGASVVTGTSVTYEVLASSNAITEAVAIPVAIYTTGTPSPGGTSTASVQLAPVSTIGTSAAGVPIPRFGASPTSGNFLTVVLCLSNIFVPWAANTAGYDTGFAIANTTTDIFGTASQSGTCVYNFFGTNAPSGGTFTTPAFGGGAVDTRLLSNIAPGFFGYIIVQCNFQLGHGFEFIVNGFGGGTPTVGQGGNALIIFQPLASGTGGGSRRAAASAALGEALGH